MNVWRLITHHADPDRALNWCWRNRRIAIGWGQIGNIDLEGYKSANEIADAIIEHYPLEAGSGGGPSLWNFCKKMQKDDLVILSTGKAREFVVEIAGDYEWVETKPVLGGVELLGDYQHQRLIGLKDYCDADELWDLAGGAPAPGESIRWTCIKCEREVEEDSWR